jgi:hypothetical protein
MLAAYDDQKSYLAQNRGFSKHKLLKHLNLKYAVMHRFIGDESGILTRIADRTSSNSRLWKENGELIIFWGAKHGTFPFCFLRRPTRASEPHAHTQAPCTTLALALSCPTSSGLSQSSLRMRVGPARSTGFCVT